MNPRVLHCPRCGAPIEDLKGALVTCKFCGSKVDLGAEAPARHYPVPVTRTPQPSPVVGVSDPYAAPPVVQRSPGLKTNTAILPPEHLLDPGAKPAHDLIISGDLSHSLAWTGPNNPLSGSVLHLRAGTFDQTLERALAYRYVAVYRPGGAALEVFVFDLKTTELLASFRTKSAGGFTQERQELALALEKATGGAFAIDR